MNGWVETGDTEPLEPLGLQGTVTCGSSESLVLVKWLWWGIEASCGEHQPIKTVLQPELEDARQIVTA